MTAPPSDARTAECPFCKGALTPEALLARLSSYTREVDAFTSSCPHCGAAIEFRPRSRTLELGYTYWAGSLHFEGMITLHAPGLRRAGAPGAPVIEYRGVAYAVTEAGRGGPEVSP